MNRSIPPCVTFIVAAFNVEKYIVTCLRSIVNQPLQNIQVIVINDASTDNTLELINTFAAEDQRFHVVNNKINSGPSAVRNIGISLAQGEFIHFVDADDYIAPNVYPALYESAKLQNTDILVFEHCRVFDNRVKAHHFISKLTAMQNKVFSSQEDKLFLIKAKIGVVVWNKLYKTSFLLDNQLRFKEGYLFEDVLFFWQTIIAAHRISILNIPAYYYVKRKNSIMDSTKGKQSCDIIAILEFAYDTLRKTNALNIYADVFAKKALRTYRKFFTRSGKTTKKAFFNFMHNSLQKMDEVPQHITNHKLRKKFIFFQNSSYNLFNLLVKLKLIS